MDEYLKNPFYKSNYCEENIWLLAKEYQELGGKNSYVCFITNKLKQVPIWCQKKCINNNEPVVWGTLSFILLIFILHCHCHSSSYCYYYYYYSMLKLFDWLNRLSCNIFMFFKR